MKKQWKGFALGIVVSLLAAGLVIPAVATTAGKTVQIYPGINIYVDDVKLEPTNAQGNPVEVFIYNGTTYLPIRAVGEAVGKTVQWDGKSRTVYLGRHIGAKPAVLLKNLDYFIKDGSIREQESTKDNLGQKRMNCIENYNEYSSATCTYRINGQYSLLSGTFFQRYDERNETRSTSLTVYGDGELLYEGSMKGGLDPLDLAIDVRGVLELKVVLGHDHGGAISDFGLWT